MAEGGRQALGAGAAVGGHGAADDERLSGRRSRHFSQWLAEHAPEVSAPAALSRAVLEDYMLWVRHESPWKPATRNQRLLAVRLLLGGAARGRPGGAAGRRGDPRRGAAARWLPAAQDAPGRGVRAVDRPGEPGAAGRARPDARAGAGVHGLSGLERGHADARLRGARVRRASVSALLQRQGQPRGDAADPAAARRAARAPAGVLGRALPGHRVAVSLAAAPGRQARRVSYQPEHGQAW